MRKGISPIVSFVLVTMLSVAAVSLALTVVLPTINKMRSSGMVNEGINNLRLLDSLIKEVASESTGSKRTFSITVTDGTYKTDKDRDLLYFEYELKPDFNLSGIRGDIEVDKNLLFSEYFNSYADGSNASSTWTILNGTWAVESWQYSGQSGIAYKNIGRARDIELGAKIYNKTNVSGQVFIIPVDARDLVGFWTFDEGFGSTAYDFSGYRNNGTLTNVNTTGNATSGWNTNCKYEKCLRLDGINDFVNITSISNMGLTTELWKKNSTDTAWYHLVNSSGTLYVNGVTGTGHVVPITNSTGTVVIGRDGSGNYFNGTIDEIRIYNRTLTASEISREYELSLKKLSESGYQDISNETNATIVLSAPLHTHFDNIKVKTSGKMLNLTIPYNRIDLNSSVSIPKGSYTLVIENKGTNTTLNKPIVDISIQ